MDGQNPVLTYRKVEMMVMRIVVLMVFTYPPARVARMNSLLI